MIRSITALSVLLAGACGMNLYTEKHRTTLLDQKIASIVQQTQHIRERSAMLRADWTLLGQPERLQSLSTRFLPQLQPMAPSQLVRLASLDSRLPRVPADPVASPQAQGAITMASATIVGPGSAADEAPSAEPIELASIGRGRPMVAPMQIMARTVITPPARPADFGAAREAVRETARENGHVSARLLSAQSVKTARHSPLARAAWTPRALPVSSLSLSSDGGRLVQGDARRAPSLLRHSMLRAEAASPRPASALGLPRIALAAPVAVQEAN